MPAKRKLDTDSENDAPKRNKLAVTTNQNEPVTDTAASSSKKKSKKDDKPKYDSLWDVILEGEGDDEDGIPVYDDCNEIRRKIRLLQKEPGHKVTHWLKAIGNVNSNSFSRFSKPPTDSDPEDVLINQPKTVAQKGPIGGAGNSTYPSAYVYFEKKRIFEGKKKTPKRIQNEANYPNGFGLETRRGWWGPA